LLVDSKRLGGNRQLFSINIDDPANVRQHTGTETGGTIAFNGAVSPDGTQIAAAAQCCSGTLTSVTLVPFDTNQEYVVPQAPTMADCRYESPSWLPDGSGLIVAGNCKGKFAVYRADINYRAPVTATSIIAEITNLRMLTNTPDADNYFPRISPDGTRVVFASNRNGAGELYMINVDGTGEMRLTSDPADDGSASWSPEGDAIIFDSNRDGDYEIYRLDLESGFITQLTVNDVDDRWPIWGQ
jgi:Tol biopolymer transport system component